MHSSNTNAGFIDRLLVDTKDVFGGDNESVSLVVVVVVLVSFCIKNGFFCNDEVEDDGLFGEDLLRMIRFGDIHEE